MVAIAVCALASCTSQANDRVTAANQALAAVFDQHEPHPAGSLLSALIPNQRPVIDPGVGLRGHIAARRAQQQQEAKQQLADHHSRAKQGAAQHKDVSFASPALHGGLHGAGGAGSGAHGASLSPRATHAHAPHPHAVPHQSAQNTHAAPTAGTQHSPRAMGATTTLMPEPTASGSPFGPSPAPPRGSVRRLLPSRTAELELLEAEREQGRDALSLELNSVIDGMQEDMATPLQDAELVLKVGRHCVHTI